MKWIVLYTFLLLSFIGEAQIEYSFSKPPSSQTRLISVGNHTIFIEPLDPDNQNQKWLTFDSTLNIVAAKKLITPSAKNLIEQTYLQGEDKIIRIDQSFVKGYLNLSAFVFDVFGNLIYSKDLFSDLRIKALLPTPFYIAQAPGKRSVALVKPLIYNDSLHVATIVFDDTLGIKTNTFFTVPHNEELNEIYMPQLNDNETMFLPVAGKFYSYKLSSELKIFSLPRGSNKIETVEFIFERKKIKGLNFLPVEDTLFFAALYSDKEKKEDVAGVLHSGFILSGKQKKEVKEYAYTDAIKQNLRKAFGSEGRKGNLLNYLAILPVSNKNQKSFNYAVLLPMEMEKKPNPSKELPKPNNDIEAIRQNLGYAALLVGTQPAGYSKPMNVAEANNYANMYGNPYQNNNNNSYSGKKFSDVPGKKYVQPGKNLLFYSFDNRVQHEKQFIKIKPLSDADYNFFAYYKNDSGYGALHYFQAGFKAPYFKSTFITNTGEIEEKKIFESRNKIIVAGFDYIVNENSFISFCMDKSTGSMSLIKIKL